MPDRDWETGRNLTNAQLRFLAKAKARRVELLERKLADAQARCNQQHKEILRLRDQLANRGREAARDSLGELLQRLGREIADGR